MTQNVQLLEGKSAQTANECSLSERHAYKTWRRCYKAAFVYFRMAEDLIDGRTPCTVVPGRRNGSLFPERRVRSRSGGSFRRCWNSSSVESQSGGTSWRNEAGGSSPSFGQCSVARDFNFWVVDTCNSSGGRSIDATTIQNVWNCFIIRRVRCRHSGVFSNSAFGLGGGGDTASSSSRRFVSHRIGMAGSDRSNVRKFYYTKSKQADGFRPLSNLQLGCAGIVTIGGRRTTVSPYSELSEGFPPGRSILRPSSFGIGFGRGGNGFDVIGFLIAGVDAAMMEAAGTADNSRSGMRGVA